MTFSVFSFPPKMEIADQPIPDAKQKVTKNKSPGMKSIIGEKKLSEPRKSWCNSYRPN